MNEFDFRVRARIIELQAEYPATAKGYYGLLGRAIELGIVLDDIPFLHYNEMIEMIALREQTPARPAYAWRKLTREEVQGLQLGQYVRARRHSMPSVEGEVTGKKPQINSRPEKVYGILIGQPGDQHYFDMVNDFWLREES